MEKESKKRFINIDISYLPLVLAALLSISVIYIIFNQTQSILTEGLKSRITAIAATSALQFTGEEVQKIIDNQDQLAKEITPILDQAAIEFDQITIDKMISETKILKLNPIREVTNKMKLIRSANKNLQYIYILELTEDLSKSKFVTDSDTVNPVDWDENGKIDEIEYPPLPGEEYDTSEIPVLSQAIEAPIAMPELYSDKWGTFLSGYAPIKNASGRTIALLAVDVQVDDFYKLIRSTLAPFVLLAILLLLLLAVQTFALVKIWKSRVEIVRELDRQKDELLSIVSHQLATPVSSLKWYVEMMLDGDLGKVTKEQKEHLESMAGVGSNLSDLVSMILDVSRIQLGRMHIEKQKLDLNVFFKEILEIITPKAAEKKVNLKIDMPKELPEAMLDRRYTHMTIENLLSNAIKYTPTGGDVLFTLTLNGNILKCAVKDTGCGIPKAEQDQIFGRMFRASNVRNTVDGNGFGLFVAKGAVEAQGGKISFQSEENKGTTFFVELPLKDLQ